ncbi:MAG: non-canonical purine NTP pyrophosphatase [Candidatus Heimdallarchaeota archaeon]|nr:non-canonical purine NTP pyrophosphatase [Candidatus Heimdallarchaeota archaeon]
MPVKKTLSFVTNNEEKMKDIQQMAKEKIQIAFISDIELFEIQSLSVEEVASSKAKQAFEKLQKPVAVSDSGLEIPVLDNFPGALVKYVNETIGQKGIIKLLNGKKDRRAFFVAVIAYCDDFLEPKIFSERDEGTIADQPRGVGWHFDRIFIPKGSSNTWAEIGREKKNENSAFRRALEKMINRLTKEE